MNQRAASLADLLAPIVLTAVVGMMVVPLPSYFLNICIALNIAASLLLIIASAYLSESHRFTTLPSLLLVSTLFRLSLNIATTRQLLARGVAPEIVEAFGKFVVSGNVVVGLVIFLIITLVQFIVIAKGAERVAEVSARFTLDALPGKQMSIDADVRSGVLNAEDARLRRLELQQESKFYGALDGAMKFVKGDAIAGLLITAVNIVGGLIVGICQQGLAFGLALERYTIFTVGDGLVSQIPALLVAVAAGIVVTRVQNGKGLAIGGDVLEQLGGDPRVLVTTSGVLIALACVPGIPGLPFALAALCLFCGCAISAQSFRRVTEQEAATSFRPEALSRILFRMRNSAAQQLRAENILPAQVQNVRSEYFHERGIVVPDVHFELRESQASEDVEILLDGVKSASVQLPAENLSQEVEVRLRGLLSEHIAELLDDTHTRQLLQIHQSGAEDLIHALIPNVLSVTRLTTLLRELAAERVSVRDVRAILQAAMEFCVQGDLGREINMSLLVEAVRLRLKRAITESLRDGERKLRVWVLTPEWEEALRACLRESRSLYPQEISALLRDLNPALQGTYPPILVVGSDLRRFLWALLPPESAKVLSVLSWSEVQGLSAVEICGTIQQSSEHALATIVPREKRAA